MIRNLIATLAAVVVCYQADFAAGQDKPADQKKEETKAEEKKAEPKRDPKVADYERAVKDLKRVDGPFPIYVRKKDILLELPESKLGQVFLIQSTLNTALDGSLLHAGMPLGLSQAIDAFRFDRNEEQLWLVRPRIRYQWDKNDPLVVGIERTFQEAILGSYRIEQTNPEKKLLLVNVTGLFLGEPMRTGEMMQAMLGGPYALDREKSGVDRVLGFPENTVLRMSLHYFSGRGAVGENPLAALFGGLMPKTLEDDRSAPVKITYNVWWRKETGYQARFADPRVGYFTTDSFTFNRYTETERTQRLINRFHLVKKDPKAAISEPVKPIVWTIDPSVPERYRNAVREGVMMWAPAFERAGFKNAIQVQDAPKDENYDHADGRYNVIRFSPSEDSLFAAIALFRTDPWTGEVLNAAVTLDANIIAQLTQLHQTLSPPRGDSKARLMQVFTRRQGSSVSDERFLFDGPVAEVEHRIHEALHKNGWVRNCCSRASEMANKASVAWLAMAYESGLTVSADDFVKDYLRDTVAHEVGHCLGLRHNFAASTHLSTAELANDATTAKEGITASVMEYYGPNVQAVLRGRGSFFSSVIGEYDKWAIEYGYTPFAGRTTLGERPLLAQIARRSGLPGNAFMTDEDADRFDPYAVRFDMSSDPLNYMERSVLMFKRAKDAAIKNLPMPGESYTKRTRALVGAMSQTFRSGSMAARFVGGVAGNRNFRGDANERPPLKPVDPALQRQAMRFIARNFLAPGVFSFPEDVINQMTLEDQGGDWTAPLRDFLGTNQQRLVALVMGAATTDRIAENAYKTKSKSAYQVDEHYGLILANVFSEVGKGVSIDPLRRDLQRFVLTGLTMQASAPSGAVSEDVRMVTAQALRRLEGRFEKAIESSGSADSMTRLHLKDMLDQVKRFQDREMTSAR
jgi:hypothetical protein